jgi:uncharacterized membrane protein
MMREGFISALRVELQGAPPAMVQEIVADYEAHFSDGVAAGRSEADVAAALGDPRRLARELRAEAGMKRWEAERSPANAAGAIIALIGLGAIDIMFLLPFLMGVIGVLLGCFVGVIVMFVAGGAMFAMGPFSGASGGPFANALVGLGVMALAAAGSAVLGIFSILLTNAIVWFGRLHFRLLKPAIGQTGGEP